MKIAAKLNRWIMSGLFAMIVIIAGWMAYEVRTHEHARIQQEMLRQAGNIAAAMENDLIRELSFRPEDLANPAYQRIALQLSTYAETADLSRLYTFTLRDGRLVSGPESVPTSDPQATPPGTILQEPYPEVAGIFKNAQPRVYRSRTKNFCKGFDAVVVPIIEPQSGDVHLALAMEAQSLNWCQHLIKEQLVPFAAFLIPMGTLFLGVIIYRKKGKNFEWRRNVQVSTYFTVMLLMTLIAFICIRNMEREARHARFVSQTDAKSELFSEALKDVDQSLQLLSGLFGASQNVSREEFGRFCSLLLDRSPMQSCLWMPEVSPSDAEAFAEMMSARGQPGFSIRRFDGSDPEGVADTHKIYPVVYSESAQPESPQTGYDLYSHPSLREAIDDALQTGLPSAALATGLECGPEGAPALFVFSRIVHPLQSGLIGFSMYPEQLIGSQSMLATKALSGISATLFELQPGMEPRSLACSDCAREGGSCGAMFGRRQTTIFPIFTFGKSYLMLLTAQPQWYAANPLRISWAVLIIGLALTLVLTYLAAVLLNRPLLLEKKVQQRTRELAELQERCDIATASAAIGIWERDADSGRLIWDGRMYQLYGREPEMFDGTYPSWIDCIHSHDRKQVLDRIEAAEMEADKRGGSVFNMEFRITLPGGGVRQIQTFGKAFRGNTGAKPRLIGVAMDITERNETQQALEMSRQLLCNIIDTLPERVWWKDLDSRFMGCNIHVAHDAGFDHPNQVVGKTDFDLPWADQAETFLANDRRVIESGVPRLYDDELQILADGMIRWISATTVPLKDTNGRIIGTLSTYSDITERKQAEDSLRELSGIQSLILNNSSLGIALIENRSFKWVNPRLCELLDIEEKELCGASTRLLYVSESEYLKTGSDAYEVLARNQRFDKTIQFQRGNGECFWCRLVGKAIDHSRPLEGSSIWMFEDMTKRVEAEENLMRLSTAIEQSPEAVVITDADGTIQYVNPAFETASGYAAVEAVGRNPSILKSGEHPVSFYENMWKTISNGEAWRGQIVNKRKDGSLYTEQANIAPVRAADGQIVNYVAVKRDITAELVKEGELQQAQKMNAIGQLAGGVAHDFNNILQGILGFSEILRLSLDDSSLEYDNANEIHKAAKRAAKLTQQLLTFSRKQPVQITAIDLNNVVLDSEALLAVLLTSSHELVLDLSDELPPAYADQNQITQIIMNLAVNARDAMPDGGRLCISTECVHMSESDAAYIAGARQGNFLCLSVTDTGCGMDTETKSHIFEPFFTTKEVGSGTGLGLAVIYGIVEQNKGWINVYSETGKGSCFKVYLPAQPAAGRSTEGDLLRRSLASNCRILVVDDDPDILSMAREVLGDADYSVIMASNAEEGLALFEQEPDGIDLLVCDMELPGMRGDKLAEILCRKNPALPVLLISGYRDHTSRWEHLADEQYSFINKPFTVSVLLDTVASLLKNVRNPHVQSAAD